MSVCVPLYGMFWLLIREIGETDYIGIICQVGIGNYLNIAATNMCRRSMDMFTYRIVNIINSITKEAQF